MHMYLLAAAIYRGCCHVFFYIMEDTLYTRSLKTTNPVAWHVYELCVASRCF